MDIFFQNNFQIKYSFTMTKIFSSYGFLIPLRPLQNTVLFIGFFVKLKTYLCIFILLLKKKFIIYLRDWQKIIVQNCELEFLNTQYLLFKIFIRPTIESILWIQFESIRRQMKSACLFVDVPRLKQKPI